MILIPAEGASQVFISLVVSTSMVILFANCRPYQNSSDDVLAQFCQLSLTFAMAVGLLEKAADSFQDDVFGSLLIVATTTNLVLGLSVILSDLLVTIVPENLRNKVWGRLAIVTNFSKVVTSTWHYKMLRTHHHKPFLVLAESPALHPYVGDEKCARLGMGRWGN